MYNVNNSKASFDACTSKEHHLILRNFEELGMLPFLHTFFTGLKHDYKMCCVLFFLKGHMYFHRNLPEFCDQYKLLGNNGQILCPDCLVEKLTRPKIQLSENDVNFLKEVLIVQ